MGEETHSTSDGATEMADRINRRRFLSLAAAPILMSSDARASSSYLATAAERSWVTTGHAFPEMAGFDTVLESFMRERGISGASLAVTRDRRLLLARGYTYSDDIDDKIVEPVSVFRVASLSKPITAVAILRLVQDGQLNLTDRLVDLVRLAPPRARVSDSYLQDVTLLNLLQHLGGWNSEFTFDPMFADLRISSALAMPLPISKADIAMYMTGQPLQHLPGTTYSYSNYGYSLLGRIVESLTGMPYQDYVQTRIFAPLRIATAAQGRSRYIHRRPEEVKYHTQHRCSTVLDSSGVRVSCAYGGFNLENMDSHGGWVMSAVDLARFAATFDEPQLSPVLDSASVDVMFSLPENIESASYVPGEYYYGCGWSVRDWRNGRRNTWHLGSMPGTSALLVRRWDGVNWCVLFNQRDDPSGAKYGEIDSLITAAANSVPVWPDHDLFSEYLPPGNLKTGVKDLVNEGLEDLQDDSGGR